MKTLTRQIVTMPPQFGASFGLINASLSEVAHSLFKWREELNFSPVRVDLQGGLAGSAGSLLPLGSLPIMKELLVATRHPRWTAYFDSMPQGGDPAGPVLVLSRHLGEVRNLTVTSVPFRGEPGAIAGRLGGLIFSYSASGVLSEERSIALVEGESSSSRHHFETWGPVQPWEVTERYASRLKRQRFDSEMIEQYCRALGIDVFNLDFYSGPAVLIERTKF